MEDHLQQLQNNNNNQFRKNLFQCNIAIDLKNAQNFGEEAAKQQMVFLASILESYESLVAGNIGNTNLTKEDYDQIDPEEMELIDIRWCMASEVRRAQRFMEITAADETTNPFREDYYKRAIYHQNKSEPPRMKQIEENPKEKSRALVVIHDDEGYDWSDVLPEEDAVGYAFMAKIVPFKDTRTEEEKYVSRKSLALTMKDRHFRAWKEAKSAKRWDADRECYLDPKGNILVEPSTLLVETLIEQIAEEEEANQRLCWGSDEEEEKEKELQSKKIDDGIIDTTKEFTAENLKKMADKVLAAKELEVESKSRTESKSKVSSNDSTNESGKTDEAKSESDCKNCMKNCKVCSTLAYLSGKKTEELTERVREVEKQILSRDKLVKASNDRLKELTDTLEKDKIDVERIKKENEKLVHENRQLSENYEKLKRTTKDSDERNDKTVKENFQLTGVLQSKEKQINQQLDEIANLKLQFQEAKIENECINVKLNSYNSASFVLQHIVPKPIGKNKAGENVYSDGTGFGYHQNPGDSWRFNYDTLWDSFVMEEELEFFYELDILREYESSQERFPAESSRRQWQTSNDNEAGPSNAREHDDIQQSSEREHAPDN
ncbi:ELKS/Rab6-interacting/CAST family member 1-like [Helianthus annuus]|uniref:ELKS/Rab6-interacting/CAST family member 1-like n=1 Tax=Helianthus annuus TaxID=4232 RepID=UPI0016530A36|nr:ELKS/Rab6-interacting/CAST family member 1-like [Helianthus annuus]